MFQIIFLLPYINKKFYEKKKKFSLTFKPYSPSNFSTISWTKSISSSANRTRAVYCWSPSPKLKFLWSSEIYIHMTTEWQTYQTAARCLHASGCMGECVNSRIFSLSLLQCLSLDGRPLLLSFLISLAIQSGQKMAVSEKYQQTCPLSHIHAD